MANDSTKLGETPNITPEQCRMARGALNISIPELAVLVGVSKGTVERLEAGAELKASTLAKVRSALEAGIPKGALGVDKRTGEPRPPTNLPGVLFIEPNGLGAGVRLRKAKRRKS